MGQRERGEIGMEGPKRRETSEKYNKEIDNGIL